MGCEPAKPARLRPELIRGSAAQRRGEHDQRDAAAALARPGAGGRRPAVGGWAGALAGERAAAADRRARAGAGPQDLRGRDPGKRLSGVGVSERVTYARELVAAGHRPAVVARILRISRQAIYRVRKPKRPPASPAMP